MRAPRLIPIGLLCIATLAQAQTDTRAPRPEAAARAQTAGTPPQRWHPQAHRQQLRWHP
jgi:hypothetical protein